MRYDDSYDDDPYDDDRDYRRDSRRNRRGRSGEAWLGIASFGLSIASGLFEFLTMAVLVYILVTTNKEIDDNSPEAMALGCAILLGLVAAVVALGLGIGGLAQKSGHKVLAGMGVAISACIILGIGFLCVVGVLAG